MFARLLALFVIVPAIELYLLIKLGTLIGAAETFALILITGIVGSYLAKSQGLSVWNRLQRKLGSGSIPGQELLDGVIILVSGALLITPGVLTDVVGLLGLFPLSRAAIRRFLKANLSGGVVTSGIHFGATSGPSSSTVNNNGYQNAVPHSVEESPPSSDPEVSIHGQAKRRPS